jgi:hypothetical protein
VESASHAESAGSGRAAASSEERRARRKRHAIGAGTVLTAIGLAITLVFNTLGVRDSARQQKRTREATQLQLFTQLDQELNSSMAVLTTNKSLDLHPSPQRQAQLNRAYDDLNYMAWLFNHGYLTLPGTQELVLNRLRCVYKAAALLNETWRLPEVRRAVGPNPPCNRARP